MDRERIIAKGIEHLEQMEAADWKIEFKILKWFVEQCGGTCEEATIAWNSTDGGKLPPFIRFNPLSPNENKIRTQTPIGKRQQDEQ